MLRLAVGSCSERRVDVHGEAPRAHELGEDELCGRGGAVGDGRARFPFGEGKEVAGGYLWRGALGAGEAVRNLDENRGHLRGAQAVHIHAAALVVVDLSQQPADGADRCAHEACRGEVAAYGGRPHSEVQGVPVG
jgi:hypothetical protein